MLLVLLLAVHQLSLFRSALALIPRLWWCGKPFALLLATLFVPVHSRKKITFLFQIFRDGEVKLGNVLLLVDVRRRT